MSYKSEILTAAPISSSLSIQFILKEVYLSRKLLADYEACYSCLNTKKVLAQKISRH